MPLKGLVSEEKMKLTFLGLFDYPLSKYLIFKGISHMQWGLIKKGSGTSFWWTLSA